MDKYDIFYVLGGALVVLFVLAWRKQLPSIGAIQDIVNVLNTKGGNILLLAIMAMIFFKSTLHLAYTILDQIEAKTLREDNAIALMALQFCTTSAFGGAMGAMLTMMTGETKIQTRPPAPAPPAALEEQKDQAKTDV